MNTRTSFTVGKQEWQAFLQMTGRMKMPRDPYIRLRLESELDCRHCLDGLKANSKEDERIILHSYSWLNMDKIKVSVILPKKLVNIMNDKCKGKLIPRSVFFHSFIEFQNITTFYSAIMFSNPRLTLTKSYYEWLEFFANKGIPSITNLYEYVKPIIEDEKEHFFSDEDCTRLIESYLGQHYKYLNVTKDDERRENQFESQADLDCMWSEITDLDLESKGEI